MKTNIATTREQIDRLLKCGVPAESADMSIRIITEPMIREIAEWQAPMLLTLPYSEAKDIYRGDSIIPVWSLSALLGLLPKGIKVDESPYDEVQKYELLIYPYMGGWQVEYQYCEDDECHSLQCVYGADLIEACVKAIEWLNDNGYQLNGIEKGGEDA